jgi:hypothetical protein
VHDSFIFSRPPVGDSLREFGPLAQIGFAEVVPKGIERFCIQPGAVDQLSHVPESKRILPIPELEHARRSVGIEEGLSTMGEPVIVPMNGNAFVVVNGEGFRVFQVCRRDRVIEKPQNPPVNRGLQTERSSVAVVPCALVARNHRVAPLRPARRRLHGFC